MLGSGAPAAAGFMTEPQTKKTTRKAYGVNIDAKTHAAIIALSNARERSAGAIVADAIQCYLQLFACKSCSTVEPKKETRHG